jgi:uncharacterized protein
MAPSSASSGKDSGVSSTEDYFDLLADDVVFEYVISEPGYPRRV